MIGGVAGAKMTTSTSYWVLDAGQQLLTGAQAKTSANDFIAVHLPDQPRTASVISSAVP